MIKIKPQILPKPAKYSQQTLAAPKVKPKIDLSGEENGYFKIGDRVIKTIFPR